MTSRARPVTIAGTTVPPGRRKTFELDVGRLPSGTMESISVSVLHGRTPGPKVWLSGAIHGDELNGIEIVRRLVDRIDPKTLSGTVVAVPIVNVFGFLSQSRYLPDGRDLNRSFPGSKRGSMAARLAHIFMREIVHECDVGIDFHTAAGHRTNVPQVRANLDDAATRELALTFGAPFVIDARLRDGSIREAATSQGIKVLLYEAGQVMRFEAEPVRVGVEGTLRVLEHLGCGDWPDVPGASPVEIHKTRWVRASRAGIAALEVGLGDHVEKGELIGTVGDVLGGRRSKIRAIDTGYVIAENLNPLVGQGEALVHIAIPGAEGRDEPPVKSHRRRR
jgi:predicted deacylase